MHCEAVPLLNLLVVMRPNVLGCRDLISGNVKRRRIRLQI